MKLPSIILGTMTFGESVFDPDVFDFISTYLDSGYKELDTAYVYNDGMSEILLGETLYRINRPFRISTKVNPRISGRLDAEAAKKQVNESLIRLKLERVDTVYLHFPDPATPVTEVLSAMNDLFQEGKYRELGLSNYPAWMVADICHICEKMGWIRPSVYEGIYNPLTRKAEIELNDCLNYYNMRFYAYNPLCGGLLTGKYERYEDKPETGRFINRPNYQKRYWKKSFFEAVALIKTRAEMMNISIAEVSLRWLTYHSMLNGDRGDGIIIGASKIRHLFDNIKALEKGPLPEEMISDFEKAWEITKGDSPEYFTLYHGKTV